MLLQRSVEAFSLPIGSPELTVPTQLDAVKNKIIMHDYCLPLHTAEQLYDANNIHALLSLSSMYLTVCTDVFSSTEINVKTVEQILPYCWEL